MGHDAALAQMAVKILFVITDNPDSARITIQKDCNGQLEIAPKNRNIYGNTNKNMKSIHPDDFRVDAPINLPVIPTRLLIDSNGDEK